MIEKLLVLLERYVVAQENLAVSMAKLANPPMFVGEVDTENLDMTPGGIISTGRSAPGKIIEDPPDDPADWDKPQVIAKLDEMKVEYNKKSRLPTLVNLLKIKMGQVNTTGVATPPKTEAEEIKGKDPTAEKKYSENDVKNMAMKTMNRLTDAGMSDADAKTKVRGVIIDTGKVEKLSEIPEENRAAVIEAWKALEV